MYIQPQLWLTAPEVFDSVTHENILNYFRKAWQYVFGYMEGFIAWPEMETQVEKRQKF